MVLANNAKSHANTLRVRRALCFLSKSEYNNERQKFEVYMNTKIEDYGVKAVERPKIEANKKLDLSGDYGQQIVKSETKLVMRTHRRTFKKLADM